MQNQNIKKGVDISFYQKNVNFEVMASRGVERVYIRAAYGTRKDIRFEENWGKSQGVIAERGVYMYYLASIDAEKQAQNLYEIVSAAGGEMPDQPVALDLEYNSIDGAANNPGRFRDYALPRDALPGDDRRIVQPAPDHLLQPILHQEQPQAAGIFQLRAVDCQLQRDRAARAAALGAGFPGGLAVQRAQHNG